MYVDTEDAFITKSGESGFYKTLAGKHRKETLDKLEEHGIEHGWDRRDDKADPSFEEMGVEENPETVDEKNREICRQSENDVIDLSWIPYFLDSYIFFFHI